MSHRVADFNMIAPFDAEELLEYVEEHKYTGYKPWAERIQKVFESAIDAGDGIEGKIAEKIAVKESYHAVVDHLHYEKANLKPDRAIWHNLSLLAFWMTFRERFVVVSLPEDASNVTDRVLRLCGQFLTVVCFIVAGPFVFWERSRATGNVKYVFSRGGGAATRPYTQFGRIERRVPTNSPPSQR